MDQLDLSPLIKTRNQAADLLVRLDAISAKIYENHFDLEKVLLEKLGSQNKDKFIDLLTENSINTASPSDLKNFIEKVKDTINKLPVMDLSLAFEPTEHTFEMISDWFSLNLKKQILLDIKVDRKLIGGATISFNGKHLENSILPKIQTAIENTMLRMQTPMPKDKPQPHQAVENISLGR